ncbi:TIGR03862 family flavoprotein [Alcaligenaceae bacterium]|nr:TIGR03862 family flavoprotein [Alcaligenaceae bacterium]
MHKHLSTLSVAVIGGGPAGLMAAETLMAAGVRVDLYDAMPSVGRKFLLAGRGGLNLTHSEPADVFRVRFGARAAQVASWLDGFGAQALRDWAHTLGIETFVGSSGRVFPKEMKAAPLLRVWLQRLRASGVSLHARHRWIGWSEDGSLLLDTPDGQVLKRHDAVVLALGGASWARLGSNGAWQAVLADKGVGLVPLQPANGGFLVDWSAYFSDRYAGEPLKSIAMAPAGQAMRRGECMITANGLEGGLIYAWSSMLREDWLAHNQAVLHIDLLPARDQAYVLREVTYPRGARSWSSHLGSRLGLKGVKLGLLRECLSKEDFANTDRLAQAIKCLPVRLHGMQPLDQAISTAGGVSFDSIDQHLMLRNLPGVFCTGEMLDWEAPTGGYLLTACFAGGRAAGRGVLHYLGVSA